MKIVHLCSSFELVMGRYPIAKDVMPYAVLLLIPSDDRDGYFQRVGMGFVIPGPETKEVSAVHQTIKLI